MMASHPPRFLDTNILLRFLTNDDPEKARRALALLLRVEAGEERVVTSPLVIFETIFTLQSLYRTPREQIVEKIRPILALRELELRDKSTFLRALERFGESRLSFTDVHAVASMEARGINEIYTWDTDFDRIEGITRVEPSGDSDTRDGLLP